MAQYGFLVSEHRAASAIRRRVAGGEASRYVCGAGGTVASPTSRTAIPACTSGQPRSTPLIVSPSKITVAGPDTKRYPSKRCADRIASIGSSSPCGHPVTPRLDVVVTAMRHPFARSTIGVGDLPEPAEGPVQLHGGSAAEIPRPVGLNRRLGAPRDFDGSHPTLGDHD
jgi:hypothetical protein